MIRDAYGRPVQHRLEPAFAARLMLLDWCGELATLLGLLRRMEEAKCVTVPRNREVARLINQAKRLVTDHIPWEVCHCQGADRNCSTCQGQGWIGLAESRQAQQSEVTVLSAPAAA